MTESQQKQLSQRLEHLVRRAAELESTVRDIHSAAQDVVRAVGDAQHILPYDAGTIATINAALDESVRHLNKVDGQDLDCMASDLSAYIREAREWALYLKTLAAAS